MAEGVPTNNQRGLRSGPCRLWRGLDKARHIVPTALLVRDDAMVSYQWEQIAPSYECKIQKNWCTVTVAPTIEHHDGHSRPLQSRGETRCPGGVSVSCLASPPAMNASDTTKVLIWKWNLYRHCHRMDRNSSISRAGTTMMFVRKKQVEKNMGEMYPVDTTESNYLLLMNAWCIRVWLGETVNLHVTPLDDKCDDFNFHVTNIPSLNSKIPSSPAFRVLSHSKYDILV